MAFEQKQLSFSNFVLATEPVLTSAAVIGQILVTSKCMIERIELLVSTTLSSSGNTVVTFSRRPTIGSATGAVLLGTLTIPTATAAGKTMYKDITPVAVYEGEVISVEVTTAATSAGKGYPFVIASLSPEQVLNESNMVLSA